MDWNWFFSALAQSGAAIIGIIGAFIISKLIDLNEKINICVDDLNTQLIKKKELKSDINNTDIKEFNRIKITQSKLVWDKIQEGEFDNKSDEEVEGFLIENLKLFPQDNNIMNQFLKTYGNHIVNENDNTRNKESFKIHSRKKTTQPFSKELIRKASEIKKNFLEQKDKIEQQIEYMKILFVRIKSYERDLKSIKSVLFILMVSLIILVIYPLHFLPLELGESPNISIKIEIVFNHLLSIKGVLLIMLLVIVISVLSIFLLHVKKSNETIKSALKNANELDIKSYSEYL